jgi:TolB-like protein/tetratricopeptide (TPR) repeat protein
MQTGEGIENSADSEPPVAGAPEGSSRLVFLSYASTDLETANSVCRFLENRGVSCWLAPRDVRPGTVYADAIVRAINDARALVLVLSGGATASAHVGREVERAASKRKPIIAFRIDAAPLSPELEYFLSNCQWIDAVTLGMSAALGKLAEAVHQGAGAPWQGALLPASATRWNVRLSIAVAAVLVVSLAVAFAVNFWSSNHSTAQAPAVATGPASGAISDKSIAVLPFEDMSEKKDQEYFADGIAEEVLDRIAKVPGLIVVGRASSFQFKGKSMDLPSVGRVLGVTYLLEGSVRKEAERVRVTAQLVEARTGEQRWSDRFDSDLADVLGVQDTIAAEIARALQVAVEVNTAPRSTIKSPEALDAYLRGVHSLDRETQESSEAAIAQFQQALTLDPTFAPAAASLAKTYAVIGALGWLPQKVAYERAREAALRAERLDPKSSMPHIVMAEIHVEYDWDWAAADRELQQAFALSPRDSYGAQIACILAGALGRWEEGRQLGIEAVALDPLNADAHLFLGYEIYLRSGHLAEAEQSIRRTLQIDPEYGGGHYFLGEVLTLEGQVEAALAEFQKETPDDGRLVGSALALFAAGHRRESDTQLAAAIRQNEIDWPEGIASVYAFRGEKDRAFEWLNRAYAARDHLYLIKGNLLFKHLEGDSRYKAFLKKMNLPD